MQKVEKAFRLKTGATCRRTKQALTNPVSVNMNKITAPIIGAEWFIVDVRFAAEQWRTYNCRKMFRTNIKYLMYEIQGTYMHHRC